MMEPQANCVLRRDGRDGEANSDASWSAPARRTARRLQEEQAEVGMPSPVISRLVLVSLLLLVIVSSPACAAVAGIFKAGMWVGIIFAVVIIGGGLFVVSRFR